MVAEVPRQMRDDARTLYEQSELPDTFAFVAQLSPVNQRLFARDLWPILARVTLEPSEPTEREFLEFIEGWIATAELDADPEASAEMRRSASYRPFRVA